MLFPQYIMQYYISFVIINLHKLKKLFMFEDIIKDKIFYTIAEKFDLKREDINLLTPPNSNFGDYSLSVAMKLSKTLEQSPLEIAKQIKKSLKIEKIFKKVEVANPGFVNLFLSDDFIIEQSKQILKLNKDFGKNDMFKGKNVLVEFTDPNPFKILHIGHLYTNIVGESLARLYEFSGANVRRANYQGDVGLHVGKTLYGIKERLKLDNLTWQDIEKLPLTDRVAWLGKAYVYGSTQFEENSEARSEIYKYNMYAFVIAQEEFSDNIVVNFRSLEKIDDNELEEIKKYYLEGRKWSLDYFEDIYKRLNAHFDYYFFESVATDYGMQVVKEGLEKGVLEKDDGSVIFRGEKYGLHTRVFVNKKGLPTYEAKDLGLAIWKYKKIKYDKSIVITGNEQDSYFKVILKVLELLYPNLAQATTHLSHGMVKLPGAKKMSSRKGNILGGEWLLNEVVAKVGSVVADRQIPVNKKNSISEKVGIGALKYAFLHNSIGEDVIFDLDKVTQFDGDTCVYVQYALVRAYAILRKVSDHDLTNNLSFASNLDVYSANILKLSLTFPNIVKIATMNLAPSMVISFLYKLARAFNEFYTNNNVLKSSEDEYKRNIFVVKVVVQVLENGLSLLNIPIVQQM